MVVADLGVGLPVLLEFGGIIGMWELRKYVTAG